MRRRGRTHLIIPDCQVKPGVNTDHLEWIGRYIAEKRPNVVVCIGDFADMPSLSSYDRGKKCFEGRRYKLDIEAAKAGMARLMGPIKRVKGYRPQLDMFLGNHDEARILRAIQLDAVLDGTISPDDLEYKKWGWRVHPFLEVVEIDGVEYSHYFTTGVMQRPVSSARVLLNTRQGSAIQGHVQKFDMAVHERTGAIAMMVGICYTHKEEYLTPQGQSCRQQIVMLHEVMDGSFDPMFVSLGYLKRKFSKAR